MEHLAEPSVQKAFLHEQALLARHEIMDLLCRKLGLPLRQRTYSVMNALSWHFAQKLIRSDGRTFWATDTRYPYGKTRRDNLLIHGSEYIGHGDRRQVNALCCQAVLFLTITNLFVLRTWTSTPIVENTMTFVLGRWFQPHSSASLRDSENRPVCPGPLAMNHCLWEYARSEVPRRAMLARNDRPSPAFERQRQLFGRNRTIQISRWERDKYAYYCLLETQNIIDTTNMCPEFIADSYQLDYTRWLQSVTLI